MIMMKTMKTNLKIYKIELKLQCKINSIKMFSEHPKSKFWSERNILKPNQVALNSHKKFWFDCECGHPFEKAMNNVNSGRWCPYCVNKKLCSESKNCIICIGKSFASVDYSKNWSCKK